MKLSTLASVLAFTFASGMAAAQNVDCGQIHIIAEMARAKSFRTLSDTMSRSGDSYRARVVFAYRAFQLAPESKVAAERLLALIPKGEAEHVP